MPRFCFTGNPFVDAGIAGMCAIADVYSLEEMNLNAVELAVRNLLRLMTGDMAFEPRRVEGKSKPTAFATSELAIVFPNGPHVNPSNKTKEIKAQKYRERVQRKCEALKSQDTDDATPTNSVCFVDGSPAAFQVGNDEFPLVDSRNKRNFHPGLGAGHPIGALTALALEFFPLSVLRSGHNSGIFWFVHTANEWVAIECARLTIKRMNECVAKREGLGFYGDWDIRSRDAAAALVAVIRRLASGGGPTALGTEELAEAEYPVTAYIFSNDNRSPQLSYQQLPHELFRFFSRLHSRQVAFNRFYREVLAAERMGALAAHRMLDVKPVISLCTLHATGTQPGKLLGGWRAHCYYATEVCEMNGQFIATIEDVGLRVARSEDASDLILALRQKGSARAALLRICRDGLMTEEEFYCLAPPENSRPAWAARDYLLAVLYDIRAADEQEQEFERWEAERPSGGEKHPLVQLAESIGARLAANRDVGKRAAIDLARGKRLSDLRAGMLRPVRKGILSWRDFVALFPPEDSRITFLERDYLLAYLYTHLRDEDLPEAIEVEEESKTGDRPLVA